MRTGIGGDASDQDVVIKMSESGVDQGLKLVTHLRGVIGVAKPQLKGIGGTGGCLRGNPPVRR